MLPATAFVIFPILSGILIDYFTDVNGVADFSPAFFVSAAFELTICFLIFVLPLHVGGNTFRYEVSAEPTGRNYTDEAAQKYKITLEMVVISIIGIFAGIAWGIEQVRYTLIIVKVQYYYNMFSYFQYLISLQMYVKLFNV